MTNMTNTQNKESVAISLANGDVISGTLWGYPKDNNYLEIDSVQDNHNRDKPIGATIDGHEIEHITILNDRIFIELWNRQDSRFNSKRIEFTLKTKHIEVSNKMTHYDLSEMEE